MQTNKKNPFGTGFASSPTRGEGSQASGQQQPQQQSMSMAAWQQPRQFGNVADAMQHQDAFVQQFLKNQAQYNQGLRAGQQPQRVGMDQTMVQAGENIASGAYQGNPFATGNVDAIMGMFGQYGIQAPEGFRDQLISNLGQMSTPPVLRGGGQVPAIGTGPGMGQQPAPQPPMTGYPVGPGGEYWPGFSDPQPQIGTPVARKPWSPKWGDPGYPVPDMGQQPSDMRGGPGGQLGPQAPPQPPAPWQPPPPPPWGYRDDEERRTAEHQSYLIWLFNQNQNPATLPHQAPTPQPAPQAPVTQPQMPEGPLADWGFRPFVELPRTPEQQARDAEMMRRAEEASARLQREQQQARLMAEMQARYPTMDPVYARRNGQDQMVGWQPNQQRTADAARQQEQRLLSQGYIEGPRKSNGEKTWISPQQQAHRLEQLRPGPAQAQPVPERSQGTPYVPPSQRPPKPPPKTKAKDRAKAQALMRSGMGMR